MPISPVSQPPPIRPARMPAEIPAVTTPSTVARRRGSANRPATELRCAPTAEPAPITASARGELRGNHRSRREPVHQRDQHREPGEIPDRAAGEHRADDGGRHVQRPSDRRDRRLKRIQSPGAQSGSERQEPHHPWTKHRPGRRKISVHGDDGRSGAATTLAGKRRHHDAGRRLPPGPDLERGCARISATTATIVDAAMTVPTTVGPVSASDDPAPTPAAGRDAARSTRSRSWRRHGRASRKGAGGDQAAAGSGRSARAVSAPTQPGHRTSSPISPIRLSMPVSPVRSRTAPG